jgi:hypothetical protein
MHTPLIVPYTQILFLELGSFGYNPGIFLLLFCIPEGWKAALLVIV